MEKGGYYGTRKSLAEIAAELLEKGFTKDGKIINEVFGYSEEALKIIDVEGMRESLALTAGVPFRKST